MSKRPQLSAIRPFGPSATRSLPLIVLVITTLVYLYFKLEKLIKCPSCYLFSDGGDGLKNYFTPAYYVAHDKGLWFHGMNYPYGEHPLYTDNQPILSLLMKLIHQVFPMDQHVIGTMNMLMIASIVIGVIAIYFLLREFNLPRWYAALVSLPIAFLSPQLERINGHYGLSYVCFLPLFLLLFMRWQKHAMFWKRGLGLLAFIVLTAFVHLYFFFITAAFMMAFLFVAWVRKGFRWNSGFSRIFMLVGVSGIMLYLPVKLTDPIKDRVKESYGLYVFTAEFVGTLLPWHGRWDKIWKEDFNLRQPGAESHGYVGVFGVMLLPFVLLYAFRNLVVKRRREAVLQVDDTSPGVYAWAVFLVWFMATGWFYMAGGSVLIEAFPVIGQFRSLGRLGWIFYYVYTCFAAWYVFENIKSIQRRWVKISGIILASLLYCVWIYEAQSYTHEMTRHIFHQNNVFRGDKPFLDVLNQHNFTPDDFQAILQVPSIIIGTENLPVHRGHWEFNHTLQCSWETGLPIVNFNMSRTSVSHALSLLQLISTPDIRKTRLEDMNQKPLLLTWHIAQLLPTEKRLVDLADSLGTVGTLGMYKLDISDFSVPLSADTTQWEILVDESFEETPFTHAFDGSGAHVSRKDSTYLTFIDTSMTTQLNVSYWVYLDKNIAGFPATRVLQYGTDGVQLEEQVHSIHSFNPWQVKGNWVEVTFPLQTKVKGARYNFSLLSSKAVIDKVIIKKLKE